LAAAVVDDPFAPPAPAAARAMHAASLALWGAHVGTVRCAAACTGEEAAVFITLKDHPRPRSLVCYAAERADRESGRVLLE